MTTGGGTGAAAATGATLSMTTEEEEEAEEGGGEEVVLCCLGDTFSIVAPPAVFCGDAPAPLTGLATCCAACVPLGGEILARFVGDL